MIKNECLLQMFLQSPISMEYYNADGIWEAGNGASLKTFGASTDDLRGFNLFSDEAIPQSLREALKRGEPVRFRDRFDFSKVTYPTNRGGTALFDFFITPLKADTTGIIGYLAQSIDLSGVCDDPVPEREEGCS